MREKANMTKFWRIISILGMGIIVASCGGGTAPTSDTSEIEPPSVVQWNRDPLTVVFRADVVGGDRTPIQLNNTIPDCTLYGDGRVVWHIMQPNGNMQVLFDFINDSDIANFVNYLVVDKRIYTYSEGFLKEIPQEVTPVYQQITLEINGAKHITDAFANWEDGYYATLLESCQKLARTPRVFVPEGAWISAVVADTTRNLPTIYWNPNATGYGFTDLATDNSKRWIEGQTVSVLWDNIILVPGDVQFSDNFGTYEVSLQVPGVTLDAPPAPAQ
jgi:hypothetical protein